MADYPELELMLSRQRPESYSLLLRFSRPDSDADKAPLYGDAPLDLAALQAVELEPIAYGRLLGQALFADAGLKAFFLQARHISEALDKPLRLRLFVSPGVPELHSLRWELLRDPDTDRPLASDQNLLFSRYIDSRDWRPVRLRPQSALRTLIAVANGNNLDAYQLAPVDVATEQQRIATALQGSQAETLSAPVTLNRLLDQLAEEIDVLYLVCHGALSRQGQALLYLQNEAGEVEVIKGEDFARRLGEMAHPPRFIVLASCESAGSGQQGDNAAQVALAPLLNQIGVPAVLAMLGQISMRSVAEFMPRFFRELLADGQIDRAVSVARGSLHGAADFWMPALFLRLKGGRLWYAPGFGGGEAEDFPRWQAIINSLSKGKCTPILGSGISEHLYGRMDDIARKLASQFDFPLNACESDNLPEVCQFISKDQSEDFARDSFRAQLRASLLQLHRAHLPADAAQQSLPKLLKAVSAYSLQQRNEPHRLLAELDCPLYITANPDHLLTLALKAAGKEPDTVYCPWKRNPDPDTLYNGDPGPRQPLIYHILGHFRDEDSLVLTEDDYFQYLIGATGQKALIPPVVRAATSNSALLFLGFQLTDWSFRVLFRLIMSQEGGRQRDRFAHVAVQIDPEEHQLLNPKKARAYLQRYFQDQGNFAIYWGSAADFLQELKQRQAAIQASVPTLRKTAADDEWE